MEEGRNWPQLHPVRSSVADCGIFYANRLELIAHHRPGFLALRLRSTAIGGLSSEETTGLTDQHSG